MWRGRSNVGEQKYAPDSSNRRASGASAAETIASTRRKFPLDFLHTRGSFSGVHHDCWWSSTFEADVRLLKPLKKIAILFGSFIPTAAAAAAAAGDDDDDRFKIEVS